MTPWKRSAERSDFPGPGGFERSIRHLRRALESARAEEPNCSDSLWLPWTLEGLCRSGELLPRSEAASLMAATAPQPQFWWDHLAYGR